MTAPSSPPRPADLATKPRPPLLPAAVLIVTTVIVTAPAMSGYRALVVVLLLAVLLTVVADRAWQNRWRLYYFDQRDYSRRRLWRRTWRRRWKTMKPVAVAAIAILVAVCGALLADATGHGGNHSGFSRSPFGGA